MNFSKQIFKYKAKRFEIFFYGHNAEVHDFFARRKGSFGENIKKIKSLIKAGQQKKIIINIPIIIQSQQKESNLLAIESILRLIIGFNIKRVQLTLTNSPAKPYTSIDSLANYILSRILSKFSFNLLIKIKNIPLCLLKSIYGYPLKELIAKNEESSDNFIKLRQCQKCNYFKECPGILDSCLNGLDQKKIKPIIFPMEVAIEVEPRCNFDCQFCFNRNSFAKTGRDYKRLDIHYIKKIIDKINENSIESVRFTGGEAMLRNDIFDLLKYAKSDGLNVKLNTNASLITNYKVAQEIARYTDFVLISMHTYDPLKDERITGFKSSFSKKIKAMIWLKEAGLKILRVSTVATMDNILNLEKFYDLIKELKVDTWAVNRIIPTPGEKDNFSKEQIFLLVEKLVKIRKNILENNIPLSVDILNAIPLCALEDPIKLSAVYAGAWPVDGHTRFTVDPRGFAKPIYYIDKNIGNPLEPLKCWNHPFMKALRTYKMVPKECLNCPFLEKCKGGNRFCAYNTYGFYDAPDPLMDFSNIRNLQLMT